MHFRNLNQDPDLEWLAAGMAETMLSDLRSAGKRIVMRDALNTAIAEMALQNVRPTDESSAARIGRLVGAKTMVFGSYQTAAGQIRITARFVEVETSLVLDAAMVTGPLTDILGLQDQVMARLLGRSAPATTPTTVAAARTGRSSRATTSRRSRSAAAARPARTAEAKQASRPAAREPSETTVASGTGEPERPASPRPPAAASADGAATLAAYRSFSLSLAATSTAEQRRLLEDAIQLDPRFNYAKESLAALERRIERYRGLIQERLSEEVRSLRAKLEACEYETSPWDLVSYFGRVFSYYADNRLWFTMLEDLDWARDRDWPDEVRAMLEDLMANYRFMALQFVKRYDEALRFGESYLRDHADGRYYRVIDHGMSRIIDARREAIDELEELPPALEEIENQEARVRERFESAESSFEEHEEERRRLEEELASLEEGTPEYRRVERELRTATLQTERDHAQMSREREARGRLLLRRCTTFLSHKAYLQAARSCGDAVDELSSLGVSNVEQHARSLRYQQLLAYFHLGEFRRAIEVGEQIKEGLEPRDRWVESVDSMINAMPADPP
ncbi:MAG: hypothetical protein ACOCVR_00935 [Myxococcota bacterium]